MKKILIIAVIALILVGGLLLLKNNAQNSTNNSPTPTVAQTPTSSVNDFCKPSDLEAKISTEGAAGNIFGTLSIYNASAQKCEIMGNNFVSANFGAKNLKVVHQGDAGQEIVTLFPGQTAYSQIHYPNGPQCSGAVVETPISYSYKISPSESVEFSSQIGSQNFKIGVCGSDAEVTNLDVWSISSKPVNQ